MTNVVKPHCNGACYKAHLFIPHVINKPQKWQKKPHYKAVFFNLSPVLDRKDLYYLFFSFLWQAVICPLEQWWTATLSCLSCSCWALLLGCRYLSLISLCRLVLVCPASFVHASGSRVGGLQPFPYHFSCSVLPTLAFLSWSFRRF